MSWDERVPPMVFNFREFRHNKIRYLSVVGQDDILPLRGHARGWANTILSWPYGCHQELFVKHLSHLLPSCARLMTSPNNSETESMVMRPFKGSSFSAGIGTESVVMRCLMGRAARRSGAPFEKNGMGQKPHKHQWAPYFLTTLTAFRNRTPVSTSSSTTKTSRSFTSPINVRASTLASLPIRRFSMKATGNTISAA